MSYCCNFGLGYANVILKLHALHYICIIIVFSCILMCAICLCANRFGLGWAYDAICFACHMFMHFLCIRTLFSIYLWYLNCLGLFWLSFLSLLLFLLTLVVSMAPKRKSTPAQNPFHSGASSSSISAPFSLRFHDDDAHKAFSENFLDDVFIRNAKSYWRTSPTLTFPLSFTVGNGSHYVTSQSLVLSCLSWSFTPTCTRLIVQYLSRIWGTCIPVTSQLVANVLRVPRIEFPDYPSCERLQTVSKDKLMATFCECPSD